MTIVKTLQCNSCGGSIDKHDKCEYCGNRQLIIDSKKINRSKILDTVSFGVFKQGGKVVFEPAHLEVNAEVGMLRIRSNKGVTIRSLIYDKTFFLFT